MSDSYKPILDQEYAAETSQHFRDSLNLLDEVLDYGTFLLPRAFGSSPRDVKAICIIFVQLRQFLTHSDGVVNLLKVGNCSSASLQLRSLLEITHITQWILASDTEKKIHYLYVANLRRRRQSQSMAIPGTPESAQNAQTVSRISLTTEQLNQIKDEVKRIDEILSQPEFASINTNFQSRYQNRGFDEPWHKIYGKSIRQISDEIGRLNDYNFIYSPLSGVTHGSDMWKNVIFGENVSPNPIREPENIVKLAQFAVSLAIQVYKMILQEYRSGEANDNFPRKYSEWRERFLKEYSVSVTPKYTNI